MLKRTLTAILLIPPVVYLIGWSPEWLFLLAVIVAVVLGLREYFELCRAIGFKVLSGAGYVGGVGLCVAWALPELRGVWRLAPTVDPFVFDVFLIVLLVLTIPILAMGRNMDLKDYLAAISTTLFGILYIGCSLTCLVPIRFAEHSIGGGRFIETHNLIPQVGRQAILLLFMVIWAGDICAYLVGRPFGRTPFFARISPRKTWEGALAGLAGSILAGWTFANWFWKGAELKTVLVLAAWIAVAGQVGDLVESAIKRGANQKDSGALLPGHGGFLDRIDSLLFAAPALWLALQILDFWSNFSAGFLFT